MVHKKKGMVLMSGGLDSATVTGIALNEGYELLALSFDYGQRHKIELEKAREIADHYSLEHKIFRIDLTQVGGSSLTSDIDVESGSLSRDDNYIPNTYVPSRNLIFITVASSIAEVRGIETIFIGANALDYSGYPDCRPEFFNSMRDTLNKGTKFGTLNGFALEVPLQYLKKSEIIKLGTSIGVPYKLTHSCYLGKEKACGKCDSCLLRLRGFMEAGIDDPVEYEFLPEFYKKRGN